MSVYTNCVFMDALEVIYDKKTYLFILKAKIVFVQGIKGLKHMLFQICSRLGVVDQRWNLHMNYKVKCAQYSHSAVATDCVNICLFRAVANITSHEAHVRLITICPPIDLFTVRRVLCGPERVDTSLPILTRDFSGWLKFTKQPKIKQIKSRARAATRFTVLCGIKQSH